MKQAHEGDDAMVLTDREDIPGFAGRTGRILAVQLNTGDCLLKFKGRAWPISYPREFLDIKGA